MVVTGVTDPARLLRNDAATPGLPLTLTKPIAGTPWPVAESRCADASFPKRAGDTHISATIDLDRSAAIPIGERFHVR